MSMVQKPSFPPIKPMTATNSSIIDTPVTISGFIIGTLVKDRIAAFTPFLRIRSIPRAPSVPITVAKAEEQRARIREFFRALNASVSRNSSLYHLKEKPEKVERLPDSLKEKITNTNIGA